MSYTADLPAAARRQLEAAQQLAENGHRHVAAYLFGLAAECALKAMAQNIPEARRDDVFYAHFPLLRTLLLDVLSGRRAQPLRRLIEPPDFMNEWAIGIRYAPTAEVRTKPVDRWAEQAARAVTSMDG
ncbi:HEPN domain-containing protein [Vitiosangium sp. GDMCC 1.1324]|uniref:HEPN domain-containing protein n=1 Tax=Vitiosangium sp. (strain GDMCC 1.1324) TaxID=2138576 RepID=UPI000D341A9F|nr:HEPN domain-containing protein [Vitiosangium sp. GDMCC 1.1324]PTL76980.1 hypothetical protein DAT35_45860 [Vitiosangium sp. GDMCC 1.1324]